MHSQSNGRVWWRRPRTTRGRAAVQLCGALVVAACATATVHQMLTIAATAARYRMVSMTLNGFGMQPLPDDERFPVLEEY